MKGDGDGDAAPKSKTNCPSCGTRLLAERDVGEYCEESLSDDGWTNDWASVDTAEKYDIRRGG
ncbi:hypothetical protein [Haloterrigena turkmenica]|nr:hypothetical protein [Haloterrigena turkmenica]